MNNKSSLNEENVRLRLSYAEKKDQRKKLPGSFERSMLLDVLFSKSSESDNDDYRKKKTTTNLETSIYAKITIFLGCP